MCSWLATRTVMAAFLSDYGYAISHTELQLHVEEVSFGPGICCCVSRLG